MHDQIEYKITEYLRNHCLGENNAKNAKPLARYFELHPRELTLIISDLVAKYNMPIGATTENGYFWLQTEDEFNHAYNSLISRGKKILQRAKGLRIGYNKFVAKTEQLQLI